MRKWMRIVLVGGFFFFLTVIITWPLVTKMTSLVPERYDELLITWIINWDIHSITSGIAGLNNIYNTNIYYPYQNTLAYSDLFFTQALIAAPFVLFFKEPLLAHNINIFVGFILTGLATYLVIYHLTKKGTAAILFAAIFNFSIAHVFYIGRLQLLNAWGWIFAFYFLISRKYVWYGVFYIVSGLTNVLTVYFLGAFFAIYWLWKSEERKRIFVASVVSSIFMVPFLRPYFMVSRQFNYVRPITDAINFSLYLPDLFLPSSPSRMSLDWWQRGGAYPGIILICIVGLLGFFLLRKKLTLAKSLEGWGKYFLVVAGICLVMALGPAVHLFRETIHIGPIKFIPQPYAVLYYIVPGLSGFRAVWLWTLPMFFALTVASAIYLSKKISWVWAAAGIIVVFLEINWPLRFVEVPSRENFPPEQKWLAENYSGAPIIQFPIYNWDSGLRYRLETEREYFSTIHFHPMVNGFSGFAPPDWQKKIKWLNKEFPSRETISYLKKLGVKLVLISDQRDSNLRKFEQLRFIKSFPEMGIYKIN